MMGRCKWYINYPYSPTDLVTFEVGVIYAVSELTRALKAKLITHDYRGMSVLSSRESGHAYDHVELVLQGPLQRFALPNPLAKILI